MIKSLMQKVRLPKLMAAAIAIATVAVVSTSGTAFASNSFFDVPKPTSQKVCYAQYGGQGWQAAGFTDLDHCLRYVSTPAPASKADCNWGYWFVYGFNSHAQCTDWVVYNGGSGYAGDPNEWF